jgi:outer membrane lipopolysaccharide assembly protein LptE/RlpB
VELKSKIVLILLTPMLVTAIGCGYGLIGRTSNLPEDVTNIFIETLENRTTRSRIELQLTQSIIDELVTRRRYTVVKSKAESDAVLSGALTSFIVRPVQFGADGRATEYEIAIHADMELARTTSEEVLWSQSDYSFRGSYALELDENTVFGFEDATIEIVGRQFAQTLVIDLLEGF